MSTISSMFAIVARIAGAEFVMFKLTPAGPVPMVAESITDLATFYPTADEIFRRSGLSWQVVGFGRLAHFTRDGLPIVRPSSIDLDTILETAVDVAMAQLAESEYVNTEDTCSRSTI